MTQGKVMPIEADAAQHPVALDKKVETTHIETGADNEAAIEDVKWGDLRQDAMRAEDAEKNMSLWSNLRLYKKAVFWSFAVSLCIVMEGFDLGMIGSLVGVESYRRKYGVWGGDAAGYQLEPAWQSAVGQASTIGNFFGIFLSSWAQDRWGYRRTIQFSLVSLACFIFVVFFAPSIEVLFVGQLLCGLPFGALSSSCVAYASDITPTGLRGYLTTYINLCWVMGKHLSAYEHDSVLISYIGQFIAAGVMVSVQSRPDEWAYRIPFACQWAWPIPLIILVSLAPESPWFLVRNGRLEEAEAVINRISAPGEEVSAPDTIAMMRRTNQLEIDNQVGSSYLDCFKGVDRRRTEIVVLAWSAQIFAGSSFANQPVYFFQQAGLSSDDSFALGLGTTALAFVGTCLSWIVLTYFGRRSVFIFGTGVLTAILTIVGGISFPAETNQGARWAQAAFIMLWVFVFDITIGPMAYAVVGETSSTRLRAKTIGLSRNFYNLTGVWVNTLCTFQLNPTALNWKGKASFLWAGTAGLMFVWSIFRLPECKGRTYRELDILFERRIPASKFKETVVHQEDES